MKRLPPVAAGLSLALLLGASSARADEAGASTFESGARRYRRAPIDEQSIPVPKVEPKPEQNLPSVPDYGPGDSALRFEIKRFDVTGATLLEPSKVDATLAPFVGSQKQIADVQGARDALQKAYEDEGLLTVAVTIPQQTIDAGVVRLDVVEARLGKVVIANEGVRWFSDESVAKRTPHLRSGEVLRKADLEEDLSAANRNPDRQVMPILRAGEEPGTVDLTLDVNDRMPLHGSVEVGNDHTSGSPKNRALTTLSYGNLWGLEHELSLSYQFALSKFHDLQVEAGTYRAPMPWSDDQSIFAYVVNSDSANSVVNAPALGLTGKGFNMGIRYGAALPRIPRLEGFSHAISFGADRKDVKNAITSGEVTILTPITYVPFELEYNGSLIRSQSYTSMRVAFDFNRAGMVTGGSKEDFYANRPVAGVDGNYEIWKFGLQHSLRMPALLRTLAAGRFVGLPPPSGPLTSDWTLNLNARGQYATQPLISTEQMSAGGVDSVRGFLQSELFGDQGWNTQLELRSPFFGGFLGGRLAERLQLVAFYDAAQLITLQPSEGQARKADLQGFGVGFRTSVLDHVNAEVFAGYPRENTINTGNIIRWYFRVSAGF